MDIKVSKFLAGFELGSPCLFGFLLNLVAEFGRTGIWMF